MPGRDITGPRGQGKDRCSGSSRDGCNQVAGQGKDQGCEGRGFGHAAGRGQGCGKGFGKGKNMGRAR